MKTFEVHFKGFIHVEAETLQQANELMEREHPELETVSFYDEETEENFEVIGHCETSGLSIFDGDDYVYDTEGCMWLKNSESENV